MVQKCNKCRVIPLKSNFHKDINRNDGLFSQCKLCRKVYRRKNYEERYYLEITDQRKYKSENQDKIKRYRCDNREKLNEYYRNS